MPSSQKILLLAGTFEARQIADRLPQLLSDSEITASFSGAVSDLPEMAVSTHVGGFGGIKGLSAYLIQNRIDLVIDATHPFAAQMSHHAASACKTTGTALIRFDRPRWEPVAGDTWVNAADIEETVKLLPLKARVFLAIGRKEIAAFFARQDLWALVRMIEPPATSLPDGWHLELARPSLSAAKELSLMREHRITHVVSKNSGGAQSYGKIEAARELGVPVIIVSRPPTADVCTCTDIDELCVSAKQALSK
ncbi:cobalt-precorrin-6A reductase [Roseibium algae]|uniref:Cobalt-precorrin-6A reductase n=1 Tax=Roseibium algae TaxID=3123038 RepID=A0ABU8TQ30_9HYPH